MQKTKQKERPICPKHPEMTAEGVCWKIVKPDLENVQTERKYCNWKEHKDFIRRYEAIGYMIPSDEDHMITKSCEKCAKHFLGLVAEPKCLNCRYTY